jgi:hypothetical protein
VEQRGEFHGAVHAGEHGRTPASNFFGVRAYHDAEVSNGCARRKGSGREDGDFAGEVGWPERASPVMARGGRATRCCC